VNFRADSDPEGAGKIQNSFLPKSQNSSALIPTVGNGKMAEKNSATDTGVAAGETPVAAAPAEVSRVDETNAKKLEFDEFVHTSIISIQQEVEKTKDASGQVELFLADATKARGEIESAKIATEQTVKKSESALAEAESLKTSIATIKGAIEATQQAVSADLGTITQSKADIESLSASATALSDKLAKQQSDIVADMTALQAEQSALQNIVQEIEHLKADSETNNTSIKIYAEEIGSSNAAFAKLSADTQTQYDSLATKQTALQAKITEIDDAHVKIVGLRRALLESTKGAKSVQDEIKDLHTQIDEVLVAISGHQDDAIAALETLRKKAESDAADLANLLVTRFDNLHETLQAKILSLLPSAGAAGLSSTYYDAKSRYAPTSYAGKPGASRLEGWRKHLRSVFGYNPASVIATGFFYVMFVVPLAIIAFGSLQLLYKMENDVHFVLDYRMLAVRFLIVLPLATLSGFGFASLQLYRKLYEEYNHKQRVMELYQSFRDEIATNGDEIQQKELLTIMLRSVANKAWETTEKPSSQAKSGDVLSNLERLTDDIGKLKSIVGA
jgi:hypothetical protein